MLNVAQYVGARITLSSLKVTRADAGVLHAMTNACHMLPSCSCPCFSPSGIMQQLHINAASWELQQQKCVQQEGTAGGGAILSRLQLYSTFAASSAGRIKLACCQDQGVHMGLSIYLLPAQITFN